MNTEVNTEGKLTHINDRGEANMVDVSEKADTKRTAIAEGFVNMRPETLSAIVEDGIAKGDVFADARIAGIMAAKKTSALIPLCHPLMLTKVAVDLTPVWGEDGGSSPVTEGLAGKKHTCGIKVQAMASLVGKTGVEMEALTAVSVACLTIYDMCKAIDKGMEITDVHLLKKEGGKSGTWQRG